MTEVSNYKGIIACPFCGAKTFVIKDTHGRASHYCKCGRLILVNFDTMSAESAAPVKGGTKYLNEITYGHRLSR